MDEMDLENINQIDMECNETDDDDFGGSINTISANSTKNGIKIDRNFGNAIESDYSHINEIDMECEPDEDEGFGSTYIFDETKETHDGPCKTGIILDFGDDEDIIDEPEEQTEEVTNHELVAESKKRQDDLISQGEIESDYLKKLQKKHAATNKQGAYTTHFHFAGNPELEKDMFNHDMGSDFNATPSAEITTGQATGEAAPAASASCSESINNIKSNNLLNFLGYIVENKDGAYKITDRTNNESYLADTLDDVKDCLYEAFDACVIIPLEIKTGKHFNDAADWLEECDNEEDKELIDTWVNHFEEVVD